MTSVVGWGGVFFQILIQRDEESPDKHPVLFYKKLPRNIGDMQVLLCDPMLATGGSALMAIRTLAESGVKVSRIVFVTVLVCPEVSRGSQRLNTPKCCTCLNALCAVVFSLCCLSIP